MPSDTDTPHPIHDDDSHEDDPLGTIYSLTQKALAIVRKHTGDDTQEAVDQLRDRPPEELIRALRAPENTPRTVRLTVDGERACFDIKPIGHPDPRREREIWQSILRIIRRRSAA